MSNPTTIPTCPKHPYSGFRIENGFGKAVCPKCHKHLGWAEPTDTFVQIKPACVHCDCDQHVKMRRVIAMDGHSNITWWCESCERYALRGGVWITKFVAERTLAYYRARSGSGKTIPNTIDEIPLLRDDSGENCCYICGEPAQYHHFMPQKYKADPDIASDWHKWKELATYLCQRHHTLWHEKIAPLSALAKAEISA